MSKANVIKELGSLVEEMEPFFRYLKRGIVDAFKNDLKGQTYNDLRNLLKWLQAIYHVEYTELKKCWALVPPEMWESYKHHKIKGLQEQVLLSAAVAAWKQIWECRYVIEDQKVPEPVSDQVVGHELQDSE